MMTGPSWMEEDQRNSDEMEFWDEEEILPG